MKEDREPLILSVDTATATRSVAVVRRGRPLAVVASDLRESTPASSVLGDIDKALRRAAVTLVEIDLLAVAAGPGSFTGLRAGLATIKSFAATLGRPIVGVPTLHAVAHAARPATHLVAMIAAGRGEVFAQSLSVTAAGELTELDEPSHLTADTLVARLLKTREPLKWAGGGASAAASLIRAGARAAAFDVVEEIDEVSDGADAGAGGQASGVWTLARTVEILAPDVAALALQSFYAGRVTEAEDLCAIYIRASDAELNQRWRAQQFSRKESQSDTPSAG